MLTGLSNYNISLKQPVLQSEMLQSKQIPHSASREEAHSNVYISQRVLIYQRYKYSMLVSLRSWITFDRPKDCFLSASLNTVILKLLKINIAASFIMHNANAHTLTKH